MAHFSSFDELEKLTPVAVIDGQIPVCDAQILMAYPFFSLSKTPRLKPIDYKSRRVMVQVDVGGTHGLATIWDADILIWAASQIVHGLNANRPTSRRIHARAYDILVFLGRGRSKLCYQRLRDSLDRLMATRVTTSYGPLAVDGVYAFNWLDGWREKKDEANRAAGLEIFLSDWFFKITSQPQACLSIDRKYFKLTSGLERWLYLLVRKHGGRQENGWSFDLDYLHRKSGCLTPEIAFIRDVRNIARRGRLLDYDLTVTRSDRGKWRLSFRIAGCEQPVNSAVLTGDRTIVLSGVRRSSYQVTKPPVTHWKKPNPGSRKLFSKINSKSYSDGDVDKALERLSQRLDPMAFGQEMGGNSPPPGPSLSAPSDLPPKQNLIRMQRPYRLLDDDKEAVASTPKNRKLILDELSARKKIPLPGETS